MIIARQTRTGGGMDGIQGAQNAQVGSDADTRLIERWLPIAALGEESVR